MNVMKAVKGRRIPVAAVVLAAAVVAWAIDLRFATGYFYVHQLAMRAACVLLGLAAVAGLGRGLLGGIADRRRRLAAAAVFAGAIGLIVLMGHEPAAANLRKNRAYLERLAGIAAGYIARHGEAPDGFDQALNEAHAQTGLILPNRGDADGHGLAYEKLGKRAFALTSTRAGVKVIYREGTVSTREDTPRDPAALTRR